MKKKKEKIINKGFDLQNIKFHISWLFSGLGLKLIETWLNGIWTISAFLILVTIVLLKKEVQNFIKTEFKKTIGLIKSSIINKVIIIILIILELFFWNYSTIILITKAIHIKFILEEANYKMDNYKFDEALTLYNKGIKLSEDIDMKNDNIFENNYVKLVAGKHAIEGTKFTMYYDKQNKIAEDFFKNQQYNNSIATLKNLASYISDVKFIGKDSYFYIKSLYELAANYNELGKYEDALHCIEDAENALNNLNKTEYNNIHSHILCIKAEVYFELGKYKESLNSDLQAYSLVKDDFQNSMKFNIYLTNKIAVDYWKCGDYDNAIISSIKSEDEVKNTNFADIYREILKNRALIYEEKGEKQSAIDCIMKMEDISCEAPGNDIDILASYSGITRDNESMNVLENSLNSKIKDNLNENQNINTYENAKLYNQLGLLYVDKGDLDKDKSKHYYFEAEKYLTKSYEIRAQIFSNDSPNYAIGLNNMGLVYQKLEKFDAAEKYFREALPIRKTLGENHYLYSQALHNLAFVLEFQGKYDESIKYYNDCIDIRRRTLGLQNDNFVDAFMNFIRCLNKANKQEEAKSKLKEVITALKDNQGTSNYKMLYNKYVEMN